jgi:hypothetical protein
VSYMERRMAKVKAMLEDLQQSSNNFEDWVSTEAYRLLPEPELRLVISGLERVGERYRGLPPDTPIPAEVCEELLTEEEMAALEHLEELKASVREKAAG